MNIFSDDIYSAGIFSDDIFSDWHIQRSTYSLMCIFSDNDNCSDTCSLLPSLYATDNHIPILFLFQVPTKTTFYTFSMSCQGLGIVKFGQTSFADPFKEGAP